MNRNECQHGRLKRQCQECDMLEELASLRQQLAEAKQENEALRFYEINSLCDEVETLRQQSLEAKKDAALWKALCKQLWVACPTTLECRAFHHAKQDQHRMTETCRPQEEYLAAIDAVNQAMREGE